MARKSSTPGRHDRAIETFKSCAASIGELTKGMHLFAITRGQFSMIDAVLFALDHTGPGARVTLWTWCIAEYEVQVFERLMRDDRIREALLIVDISAREKNTKHLAYWRTFFGDDSVRWVRNHAKIATVEGNGFRFLLRGSMNLNFNPRFEQLDISEGCPGFDLVHEIESELEILPPDCSNAQAIHASKLRESFTDKQLKIFNARKIWAK